VDELLLGAGSKFDLNGYKLYCRHFINQGGTCFGGSIATVPEPSAILLVLVAAVVLLTRNGAALFR
jgi:hypothetical protein